MLYKPFQVRYFDPGPNAGETARRSRMNLYCYPWVRRLVICVEAIGGLHGGYMAINENNREGYAFTREFAHLAGVTGARHSPRHRIIMHLKCAIILASSPE